MGGAPFLADPQSGWLNLLALSLYGVLTCGSALGAYIVAQPILAGLGLYAFLRNERISRPAAAIGGALAVVSIANSRLVVSLAFSGTLAWALLLAAAVSWYLNSTTKRQRTLRALASALAWGQLATVHASHGLAIGTLFAVTVVLARSAGDKTVAGFFRPLGQAVRLVPLGLVVNAAILIPRLAYFPRTSLGLGYGAIEVGEGSAGPGVGPSSALTDYAGLLRPGGVFFGIAAVTLVGLALGGSKRRSLPVSFAVFGFICAALSFHNTASFLSPLFRRLPFGDFYLHEPARFSFGALLAFLVIVPVGIDRLTENPETIRFLRGIRRLGRFPLVGAVALLLSTEFLVGWALTAPAKTTDVVAGEWFGAVSPPALRTKDYLERNHFVKTLQSGDGRYLILDQTRVDPRRGYLASQSPGDWPLLANQRATLFGLGDVMASTAPVQPLRYWRLMRSLGPDTMRYNASFIASRPRRVMDLFAVNHVIAPISTRWPPESAIALESGFGLFATRRPTSLVQFFSDWELAASSSDALANVISRDFDAHTQLVVEESKMLDGVSSVHDASLVTVVAHSDDLLRVRVDNDSQGVLLVRNSFDADWEATVDGESADVIPADFVMQGIELAPGSHVVELSYSNASAGLGLLISFVGLSLWLGQGLAVGALAQMRRLLLYRPRDSIEQSGLRSPRSAPSDA
jgi:hypothetical protein